MLIRKMTAMLLVSLILLTAFSGCVGNDLPTDNEDVNVISDGTTIEPIPEMPDLLEFERADDSNVSLSETRYGYYQLNETERNIYNVTVNAVGNYGESMPLFLDGSTYSRLLYMLAIEQLFWYNIKSTEPVLNESGRYFDVKFQYKYPEVHYQEMNNMAAAAAEEIVQKIPTDYTDYEKLKYIHDYLVANVSKDADYEFASTIYGALVNNKALCEGYAKSFSYLCNILGIENAIVTGFTDVPHMWNMVKLEGDWYHVDVTWDDVEIGLDDFISYQFFLVDDSTVKLNRTIDKSIYIPPEATENRYNYYYREGLIVEKAEDYSDILAGSIVKAAKENRSYAMIKFSRADEYIFFLNKINLGDKGIEDALNKANYTLSADGITVSIDNRFTADAYSTAVFIISQAT